MSIPENFPTYPQADLVREIQRLGVENRRMNQRLVAQGERVAGAESALHALATGLRWEEELRAWVLTDLGALTKARQALEVGR